eukprot:m.25961 g.25961  ORF g.25961 m.25961 type:complete len:363 (+) comp11650_c0_seq1:163-1251(+)
MDERWEYYIAAIALLFGVLGFNALDVTCFLLSLIWIYVHSTIPDRQLKSTSAVAVPVTHNEQQHAPTVSTAKKQAFNRLVSKRQTAWLVLIFSPVTLYVGLYYLLRQPADGYLCALLNLHVVVVGAVVRVLVKCSTASEQANVTLTEEANIPATMLQATRQEIDNLKLVVTRQNADIQLLRRDLHAYRQHLQNSIHVVSSMETGERETEEYVFQLEQRLRYVEQGQPMLNDTLWSALTTVEWPLRKLARISRLVFSPSPSPPTLTALDWKARSRASSACSTESLPPWQATPTGWLTKPHGSKPRVTQGFSSERRSADNLDLLSSTSTPLSNEPPVRCPEPLSSSLSSPLLSSTSLTQLDDSV